MAAKKRNETSKTATGYYPKTKGMPHLRKRTDVLAVVCSDIHLSDKPPIARSAETDWFIAMEKVLAQVFYTCLTYDAPLIIAGDIFDHWKSSPALTNFAIEVFKRIPWVYAVPGQHDLPHHNYDDVKKTAYHTLVLSGAIHPLDEDKTIVRGIELYGMPWNQKVPEPDHSWTSPKMLVAHAYIWTQGKGHPKASPDATIGNWHEKILDFDLAVFGDNHKGFLSNDKTIMNCGTLMRRKTDEYNYTPQIGLVLESRRFEAVKLITEEDKFIELDGPLARLEQSLDMSGFLDELRELGDKGLDFSEAVRTFLTDHGSNPAVRKYVLDALGGEK